MNSNTIIYKSLILLAGVLSLTACRKDLLKTIPEDRISTDVYWQTDEDATNAANAVYTYMDGQNILLWDGFSDIGHINQPGSGDAPLDQGVATALTSRVYDQYATPYKGIEAANYFLDNIGQLTPTDATLINSRKGEVRALRAYYYLKLVAWYGGVPLIKTAITVEEAATVTRTDVEEVYDFIAAELDTAASLLPTTQSDAGRITRGAALALKARAMLYAGRYELAAAAAKAVMDLNQYSLYPQYRNLFSYDAEHNQEVILDKEFIKDIYSNSVFYSYSPASMGNAQTAVVPTKAIADEYEMTNGKSIDDPESGFDPYNPYHNRDPRMHYSIYVPGDTLVNGLVYNSIPGSGAGDAVNGGNYYATTTGFNIKKYINAEDLGTPKNCGINMILIRYAEVLLTYAEAKIELGELDETVTAAINEVRQRADVNMPPLEDGLSQAQLRAAVRHERMVELAMEGLRVFDIRRWRTAEDLMTGPIQGLTYVKDGVLTTIVNNSFVRSFDPEKDYLWPIPQQEIVLNSNLEQNYGW